MVLIFAFAAVFYVLGATFVESFVNYRTWHLVGKTEFVTFHRAIGRRVIAFVVFPVVLTLALTTALLWLRPPAIPAWSVWLSLMLNLFAVAVSLVAQIPTQRKLDQNGLSAPLLRRLISIEWLRNAAHVGNSVVFLWMM